MCTRARTPRRSHLLIALGIVLLTGSAVAQPAGPRAGIEAANARFSADFAKGDATAVASHYTAAAQVLPPNGEVVKGREAIGKFWKGVMDAGVKGVKLTVVEAEAAGGTAYEVGNYALTGDGGKTLETGKYIVIWKRDGGQWKLHRDIWNSSMPAAK
jgi:ketosteroid isomerase-like protein